MKHWYAPEAVEHALKLCGLRARLGPQTGRSPTATDALDHETAQVSAQHHFERKSTNFVAVDVT